MKNDGKVMKWRESENLINDFPVENGEFLFTYPSEKSVRVSVISC